MSGMFAKTIIQKFLSNSRKTHPQLNNEGRFDVKLHQRAIVSLIESESPSFIIDTAIVKGQLDRLSNALKKNIPQQTKIFYSFKTNYELLNTNLLHQCNVGAEVVSGWEYDLALSKKFTPKNIIFNGPVKKNEEIIRALRQGATVHLDTQAQIDQIVGLSREENFKKWPGKVGLRLKTHTGSRFGYDINTGEADSALRRLKKRKITIHGLHHHGGSDIYSTADRYWSAKKIASWINGNSGYFSVEGVSLDIGGGFPALALLPRHHQSSAGDSTNIDDHIHSISRAIADCRVINQLIVEPGRWIIEDATIYAIKVIDVQQSETEQKILTNGAITQLMVSYYRPQIARIYSPALSPRPGANINSIVYGGTCKEDDVLYQGSMPAAKSGDVVIFFAVGAYNQSMASSFIFPIPPCQVLN
jgi:diaminopimelate decarboxylase